MNQIMITYPNGETEIATSINIDPRVKHRHLGDIPNCTPPGQELKIGTIVFPKQKTLCEEANLDIDVSNERCAELFAKISRDYLDGKLPGKDSWVTWRNMVSQIGKIGGIK